LEQAAQSPLPVTARAGSIAVMRVFWQISISLLALPAILLAGGPDSNQYTYVIVHGAWGGGWAFRQVDSLLTADGHKVYRPTLTGQGEKSHLASTNVDLSTHIQDIVNVILYEDLHGIVLVGHSYGGMVITGVADRVPDRIRHLIYVDAFLPLDGESVNTSRVHFGTRDLSLNTTNGFVTYRGFNSSRPLPHDVPMSARCFSEPISLKNQDAARRIPATYILAVPPGSPVQEARFYFFSERAKERGWPVLTIESDHNIQWSHPNELAKMLEDGATPTTLRP
jgi:pimeloyl-ACP methyl ester carboxylesterase